MEYSVFPSPSKTMIGNEKLGVITCSYEKLVQLFQRPFADPENTETDCEWQLLLENMHPIRIYNYKDGKKYLGDDGMSVKEITTWHVSGHYEDDLNVLKNIVGDRVSYFFECGVGAKSIEELVKKLHTIADHIEEGQRESSTHSSYHSYYVKEKRHNEET